MFYTSSEAELTQLAREISINDGFKDSARLVIKEMKRGGVLISGTPTSRVLKSLVPHLPSHS